MRCPYPECGGEISAEMMLCKTCSRAVVVCENEDCIEWIPSAALACPKCGRRQSRIYSWRMAGGSPRRNWAYDSKQCEGTINRIDVTKEWEHECDREIVHGMLEIGGYLIIPQKSGKIGIIRAFDQQRIKDIDLGDRHEIAAHPAVFNMSLFVLTRRELIAIPLHDLFVGGKVAEGECKPEYVDVPVDQPFESREIVVGRDWIAFLAEHQSDAYLISRSRSGEFKFKRFDYPGSSPVFGGDDALFCASAGGIAYQYTPDLAQCISSNENIPLDGISLDHGLSRYRDRIALCGIDGNVYHSILGQAGMRFQSIVLNGIHARSVAIADMDDRRAGYMAVAAQQGCYIFQEQFFCNFVLRGSVQRASHTHPLLVNGFIAFALDNGRCHFFCREKPTLQADCSITGGEPIMLPMTPASDGSVFVAHGDCVTKLRVTLA